MIDITPDSVAFQLGPVAIHWYGLCYALGLIAVYLVLTREAARKGQDPNLVANGMIVVGLAALVGGRLYHVIDQWALYANDPITAFLPVARDASGAYRFSGLAGLGVPGGIVTGTVAAWLYARFQGIHFPTWADITAPGLFVMQAVGRLGNFFNQELYGPPTSLPWGIAIDCRHRVAAYPCTDYPLETTHFQPLFLYESVAGILGAIVLLVLARRAAERLRPGDLVLIFFAWYGAVRFGLEFLRTENWTFFGVPTAQILSAAFIAVGLALLVVRHRSDGLSMAATDAILQEAAATATDVEAGVEPEGVEPDAGEPAEPAAAAEPGVDEPGGSPPPDPTPEPMPPTR